MCMRDRWGEVYENVKLSMKIILSILCGFALKNTASYADGEK